MGRDQSGPYRGGGRVMLLLRVPSSLHSHISTIDALASHSLLCICLLQKLLYSLPGGEGRHGPDLSGGEGTDGVAESECMLDYRFLKGKIGGQEAAEHTGDKGVTGTGGVHCGDGETGDMTGDFGGEI